MAMIHVRKRRELQTINPGQSIIIRATPKDAKGCDCDMNFFICDVIERNIDGLAVASTVTKTFSPAELKTALGINVKDRITCD